MNNFASLALRCAEAASKKMLFEDFKLQARHSLSLGKGFQDQLTVLEALIDEDYIALVDSRLTLAHLVESEWLKSSIYDGDPEAWDFVDLYPNQNWKFDPNDMTNHLLGLHGEAYVIQQLKQAIDIDIHSRIKHISLYDDTAGFDIQAPSRFEINPDAQIEVKSSTRSGSVCRFFLTKNEYLKSQTLPNWNLVFVRKIHGKFEIVGHLTANQLTALVPHDVSSNVEWASVVAVFEEHDFLPGLP